MPIVPHTDALVLIPAHTLAPQIVKYVCPEYFLYSPVSAGAHRSTRTALFSLCLNIFIVPKHNAIRFPAGGAGQPAALSL